MAIERGVRDVSPRVDRGQKSVLAPALNRDAGDGRSLGHPAIAREDFGRERRGVIDLPFFSDEARLFEVAMVRRRVSAQQERWQRIVVVDRVWIIEKRR